MLVHGSSVKRAFCHARKVLAVYMCVMCIKVIEWKSVAIEMGLVITLLAANPFILSIYL